MVVASAPRDLRSYLLGRALYAEVSEGLGFAPTPLKQKLRHEGRSCEAAGVHPANNYHFLTKPAKPPPMAGRKQEVLQLRD